MPELGKYAFAVLASYGVGLAALAGLVLLSLLRHLRVKRDLQRLEDERAARHG